MKKTVSLLIIIALLVHTAATPTGGRVPVYGKHGMVVSASMIASEVGRDVLKNGGNAIDAAVATAFALAVSWPTAGNIGGGGFIVYADKNGKATTIDFREKAPLAATAKMYLDENGKPNNLNHQGLLSVGVPGTVAGLYLAHSRYGKLPWAELVDPAIRMASKGIPFSYTLHQQSKTMKTNLERYPSSKKVLYKNGTDVYEPGEIWKQPDLAATLKNIKKHGHDGFYKGEVAQKFAAFMKANGGIITEEDLAKYEAVERKPVMGTYRGYTVYSMPPPSSGGVALLEMLSILEGYDLNKLGYKSADYVHVITETMRRAYADRAEYMGDPDFNPDLPVDKLISKAHAEQIRSSISMDKVSPSDSSRFGQLYENAANTTHLSVVDDEGNVVSMTYTLEQNYGCKIVADGLGFFLNNEMGDFNPQPGITTKTGQIGTKPNLVEPAKRMLSSMTPTILLKDGKPVLAVGSPGGKTIINSVLQVIINYVDHQMNIAQAVEAPRFHHQWLPDKIDFEHYSFSMEVQNKLKEKGHKLNELPITSTTYPGHAMSIAIDSETGYRMGAADSRASDGGAAGY
ncbi:MAG TPA: gamma-glutamyltransferase [Cyclobacteriaceae bacterium]|jgi:gamma-glutamyltranspeptidase/glutathione hydrolase|nr:gamma-glutamyltransferase [Cyclobacteriaceae bacterium]